MPGARVVLGALYQHYPDAAHGGFAAEAKVLAVRRRAAEHLPQLHPYFLRCLLDAIQTIDRAAGLAV